MNALSTCVLIALCFASSWAKTDIQMSFEPGSGIYNRGETVKLRCQVQTEEAPALGFVLQWYKKQDKDFMLLSEDEDLIAPFSENTAKYSVALKLNRKTKITNLNLTITGVEAVDVGDYKCVVGYEDEEKTESSVLKLRMTPDVDDLAFRTVATSEGSVMVFNIEHAITCKASAYSLSKDLQLVIKLQDGTDITQSFVPTYKKRWSGAEGLKIPKVTHELQNNWMPDGAGSGEMTCYYQDGDRQLAMQSFSYRRDDTTTINCSSNYKKAVKLDDLDVYITCKVYGYSGDRSELAVQWSFQYEDETASVRNGETKHLRTASQTSDGYTLFMPRISREMLGYGKVVNYNVLLYRKDGEEVAQTVYPLDTDTTIPITGGSPTLYCSIIVILSQILLLGL